jgi:hypothetical protein
VKVEKQHRVLLGTAVFLMVVSAVWSQSLEIEVEGWWNVTIDESDLQGGPGSDLSETFTSDVDQISVTIIKDVPGSPWLEEFYWRVDVRRADANWHPNFSLWIRRTANGSGNGSVSGGTVFQEVDPIDRSFFSGFMARRGIKIQLELRNMSVQIPPDEYTTTLIYTVVEL